jgi:hypothetical protein
MEREYRIKASEVPQKAKLFVLETYGETTSIKWYLEESEKGKSFEAKLKYHKKKHSVEFSLDGHIEDIEILTSFKNLPKEVMLSIENYFSETFVRFKIHKIQLQLTGNEHDLSTAVKSENYAQTTQNYEIVVESRSNKELNLWEVLFDDSGHFISKRMIIEKPSNNLDF